MPRTFWRICIGLMFSTSLVLAGCGGSPTPAATSSNQGATTEPATGEATATAQEAAAPAVTTTETVTEVATEAATTEATTGGAEGAAAAGAVEPTPPPPTLQPKPGAVTIEYWEMDWGFQQVLQNLVTEFNKQNPNIYVKMTQLEWGDYTQKLQGAVAAGTPPDISGGDSGLPFNFDAQGQAYPLDDLYNQWKGDGRFEDLTKWGQDKWSYNGHYVGVSWQIDPRAIYYRKDMFDKAGIKPPTTHDELLAAAQKLTDRSKEQFGICVPGKQGSYDTDQFYMTLVFQNGGGLADPEGKPTIDTEEQLRALQFEQELVKAAAPPGTPSYTFAEISQLYQQGKCAMVFNGGWFIGQLTSEAPDALKNTGMLPPLKGRGPKAVQRIVGFYNPWMVYKQSKHPAEAMKFIDFMMKKENLKTIYGSVSGKGSVYKSLRTDPLYQKDPLSKEMADQVEQFAIDYWYPNNKAAVGIGSMGTSIADLIVNPVLAGARSPQDALKDAQQQLAPIFEKQAP